jgi:hypothetical protein
MDPPVAGALVGARAREVSDIASGNRSPEGPGPLGGANVSVKWGECKAEENNQRYFVLSWLPLEIIDLCDDRPVYEQYSSDER